MIKSLFGSIIIILMTSQNVVRCAELWSESEKQSANTAHSIDYLGSEEKLGLMYSNLARLFPKKCVHIKLTHYPVQGPNKTSLIQKMTGIHPMIALTPERAMYENALCFAKEIGNSGCKGHNRFSCEKKVYSEGCAYGTGTSRETIIGLLIDHNIPSLGHRKICLNPRNTKTGIATYPHTVSGRCFVLELH